MSFIIFSKKIYFNFISFYFILLLLLKDQKKKTVIGNTLSVKDKKSKEFPLNQKINVYALYKNDFLKRKRKNL